MTEKVQINGNDIWIVVEPHIGHLAGAVQREYFTASYFTAEPTDSPAGVLLTDDNMAPCIFYSPVEALEYANEKLATLLSDGLPK